MYRVAENWKTNVSQGAKPVSHKLGEDMESLVVNAAKAIGCEIAGVDIIEGPNGPLVNEINSQPGFRGLQLTTKVDIAQKIVDHVISKARR
jgi:glutathione synthase/RimK-type ligase-like ATP-grasp enzyme